MEMVLKVQTMSGLSNSYSAITVCIVAYMRGQGIGATRRHKKDPRDSLRGISKPALKRLARRGGVKRLSSAVYDEMRIAIHKFLCKVIMDTTLFTEHAKRRVVTLQDVLEALKLNGTRLYGY